MQRKWLISSFLFIMKFIQNTMLYHNIHNHTTYSDGMHTPEELLRYAHRKGLELLGITDHYATTKVRSIHPEQLVQYVKHLARLKIEVKKKVVLLNGIELDASKKRTNFDSIDIDTLNTLDYVLFEYVSDPLWGGMDFPDFLEVRKKIRVPVGLAHPDIDLCFRDREPDNVIAELEKNNIFIELSTSSENTRNGKTYYRLASEFFHVLKYSNVPLAVGTDTHHDAKDIANIYDAIEFVERLGLEENVERFMKMMKVKKE